MTEKLKIDKATIARTVVLVFALVNQVLTMAGLNPLPFSNDDVYEVCTGILTVGASLVAWWKNNDITQKALKRTEEIKKLESSAN